MDTVSVRGVKTMLQSGLQVTTFGPKTGYSFGLICGTLKLISELANKGILKIQKELDDRFH